MNFNSVYLRVKIHKVIGLKEIIFCLDYKGGDPADFYYVYYYASVSHAQSAMMSPVFDVSSQTSLEVSFYWVLNGVECGGLCKRSLSLSPSPSLYLSFQSIFLLCFLYTKQISF